MSVARVVEETDIHGKPRRWIYCKQKRREAKSLMESWCWTFEPFKKYFFITIFTWPLQIDGYWVETDFELYKNASRTADLILMAAPTPEDSMCKYYRCIEFISQPIYKKRKRWCVNRNVKSNHHHKRVWIFSWISFSFPSPNKTYFNRHVSEFALIFCFFWPTTSNKVWIRI